MRLTAMYVGAVLGPGVADGTSHAPSVAVIPC
ncbi:hypothetical protein FHX81_3616 [Saccharothrix saharensis]|uniref:Uncharacterized protein n=1 Tax=Saccharothrix saharensis TaxID=571190 RepID=A0A543JEJ0_9PSEU|nr:hypothetical protein FHX81_3616 [Saccharothrix saharensis]